MPTQGLQHLLHCSYGVRKMDGAGARSRTLDLRVLYPLMLACHTDGSGSFPGRTNISIAAISSARGFLQHELPAATFSLI